MLVWAVDSSILPLTRPETMKIGLVGYQGSGKSSLFQWLTGTQPDLAQVHKSQSAMCVVPEPRIDQLCKIYHPEESHAGGTRNRGYTGVESIA